MSDLADDRHFGRELGRACFAGLSFLELLLRDGTLSGGVTLIVPLRAPVDPDLAISLFALDELSGVFVDTGLVGTVDESQMAAVFADVPAPGTYVGVAAVPLPGLLTVLLNWGPCDEIPCPGDTNGDGVVDIIDYLAVVLDWSG